MAELNALFASIHISSTGLTAQRQRMNAISENLANANTTKTPEGGPYKRKMVRFRQALQEAVGSVISSDKGGRIAISHPMHRSHPTTSALGTKTYAGVEVDIVRDPAPPEMIYEPHHPDADENGYVAMPRIDTIVEMVDLISATRAFEANISAIDAAKDIARKSLEI
ncbi:MAG: flagellar basal body rod protein FlgC [bacterium]